MRTERLLVRALIAAICAASCMLSPLFGCAQVAQESLLLSPGDLIHILVFDVPQLEQHARIADSGKCTLALIGEVGVSGLTPTEAAQRISGMLARGGYMRQAQVSVVVEQYASADIAVSGQVQHPGTYMVTTPRNLLDVLSMAGGMTAAADIHITVKRRGGQREIVYADIPNDADAALLNAVLVYPGDLVIVPKAGIVYVLGDVAHPGGYVMSDDAQLSVLQVIAMANGTTKTAAENHARLVRQTAVGPIDLPISLKAMEKGSQADIALQPEDVLYIPYSTAKNIMLGASAILSSTGGAAIYAVH